MVENSTTNEIDLETFLKAAGQSFSDAQRALLPGLDAPVNMMLSNVELDIKVAVSSDANGNMSIKPVSSVDITRGGIDPGLLSTLRITFVGSVGDFDLQRSRTGDTSAAGERQVPVLVGLTLDEAAAVLKAGAWYFEKHAAGSDEITAAGGKGAGRILRQDPSAGQAVDPKKTTVHVWCDLGSFSVKDIDGIGDRMGRGLAEMGITTGRDLLGADVKKVASALRISEDRVRDFVDMAALMSSLAVIDSKDKVELLVKGANIRSVEQLAGSDPEALHRICRNAIEVGKVRVPSSFDITAEEVRKWVNAASSYTKR